MRFYFSATLSYGAVRMVLISPLNCWRNSTPFLCKANFCTIKIYHFESELLTNSVLFLDILERFRKKIPTEKNSLELCQLYILIILHYPLQTVPRWSNISTISNFQYLNENIFFKKKLPLAIQDFLFSPLYLVLNLSIHILSLAFLYWGSLLWIFLKCLLPSSLDILA